MKTERQDSWLKGATLAARVGDARLAAKLEHCRVEADGSVMARNGTIRCTSAPIASAVPYGLRMYRDAGGTRRFVGLLGTSAHLASNTAAGPWTELETGLAVEYADFTEYRVGAGNYMVWANGTDFKAYDGTTVTDLSPAGLNFVRAFNDRLYGAGAHSNVLVATRVRSFDFSVNGGGLSLPIGPQAPVTGLEVAGDHLLVFKTGETERVSGYGETTLMVAAGAVGVSRSVGCVNFRTIQACGDSGVAWLSKRGIEFYSPANGYAECVSHALDAFFHPVPPSVTAGPYAASAAVFSFEAYSAAHSYYDQRKGEYHLFIADTLGAQAEAVFVPATGACYLWPTRTEVPVTASASTYVYSAPPSDATAPVFWGLAAGSGYLYPSSDLPTVEVRLSAADLLIPSDDALLEEAVGTFAATPSALLSLTDGAELEVLDFVAPADHYPMSITSDGYPVLREYGTSDLQGFAGEPGFAILGTVQTRPMLFGAPNRQKRARVLRASLRNVTGGELTGYVLAASEKTSGNPHTVTLSANVASTRPALVSVLGSTVYAVALLPPGLALDTVELDAEVYDRGGVR